MRCPKGQYGTSSYKCEECDLDKGQYQDREGMFQCEVVEPGYQLNPTNPTSNYSSISVNIGKYVFYFSNIVTLIFKKTNKHYN